MNDRHPTADLTAFSTRRHAAATIAAAACALLLPFTTAAVGQTPEAEAKRPNVVIVITDDQGYGDLSCTGHPTIHTPHVDALAARGVRLTQFYVPSPVCWGCFAVS